MKVHCGHKYCTFPFHPSLGDLYMPLPSTERNGVHASSHQPRLPLHACVCHMRWLGAAEGVCSCHFSLKISIWVRPSNHAAECGWLQNHASPKAQPQGITSSFSRVLLWLNSVSISSCGFVMSVTVNLHTITRFTCRYMIFLFCFAHQTWQCAVFSLASIYSSYFSLINPKEGFFFFSLAPKLQKSWFIYIWYIWMEKPWRTE